MYVVLAAGGTGGHTIPANRIQSELQKRGVESKVVATRGVGKKCRALFVDPVKVFFSFIKRRPDLVVGFGSYHAFPALISASILRIPIVLVEMNAVLGRVNRLFAKRAKWIGANIPLDGARHVRMPFPPRKEAKRDTFLIMGGSQGALSLNKAVCKLDLNHNKVVHLTGKGKGEYGHPEATCLEFMDDMSPLLEASDYAITRAGGMSIAELIEYAIPAVLVPFPFATDDHQMANARYLQSTGGALLSSGDLAQDLGYLRASKEKMREALLQNRAPSIVDLLVQEVIPAAHFLGIGGCGMSALAHILLDRGVLVSGDDKNFSPYVAALQERGALITQDHSASRIVYSTAIREDDPRRQTNLPSIHRAKLLQEQMEGKKVILVAGTHGKTSTAALLSWVLHQAGLAPSYAVGGVIKNFGRGGGYGDGDYFVAEADESDGSFLSLQPHHAIITNIEPEHLDYWGSEEKMVRGYEQFIQSVTGTLFWCGDDPTLLKLQPEGEMYSSSDGFFAQNCAAVTAVCRSLGIADRDIREGIATFGGVKRRSEYIGEHKNIAIYDDYAHHPTEVVATLLAFKKKEHGRLVVVFQPHRYTRLKSHLEGFSKAFSLGDEVIITDIYDAGESPITGLHALTLLEMLHSKRAHYTPRHKLVTFLKRFTQPGDLVITMGAGDVTHVGYELLEELKG